MSGVRYAVELPSSTNDINEVLKWCENHYGPPALITGRWMPLEFTIQFKEKKDRDWFILRWGG